MGEVFYGMGLLATKDYFDRSASDLVAPVCWTKWTKDGECSEKGLGKVLFVNEAYRLEEGPFAKEAIDELVDSLTKPQFCSKVVGHSRRL
jgi:hypothetical protein